MSSETFKIRPAGRHILTIGRDLIQDPYAAVVELVKNAYDADATKIEITFKKNVNEKTIDIVVKDDGHGMSRDVVTTKWMVPSTNDKEIRKKSPNGRILQGRKGIGRYASSILGNKLHLETISREKEKTTLDVDWNVFASAEYLSDVEIPINSQKVESKSGTILYISGNYSYLEVWEGSQFNSLIKELKKLKTPLTLSEGDAETGSFDIYLTIEGFNEHDTSNEKIEPFPLFDLYDYSISGTISKNDKGKGIGKLTYSQKNIKNAVVETIEFDYEKPLLCGEVSFDIKVFDREPRAIEALIKRGLKTSTGDYLGKNEAKALLNSYNGIGVYRNGFRIRPLGNADYDWLKLNEMRVQNPSMKVGLNQVMGIVQIQSEEYSNLIEKSARDGLKENDSYFCLVDLTQKILIELEKRRFSYRTKAGLSRTAIKVEREIERIFSFDDLKKDIVASLKKGNVAPLVASSIIQSVEKAEKEKNEAVDAMREIIAEYQGQATLGRMINVLMHEGRKPLSFFKNQVPIILDDYTEYERTNNADCLSSVFSKIPKITQNAEMLVALFNKLDPLAVKRNSKKQKVPLLATISGFFQLFENQLHDFTCTVNISTNEEYIFECREQDLYCIFVNLIENSEYWIKESACERKEISVFIKIQDNRIEYIDYKDTGPGIEKNLTDNQTIFEPGFTTKPHGYGLGLSIAGEASERCGMNLFALECNTGAYFRLQSKG